MGFKIKAKMELTVEGVVLLAVRNCYIEKATQNYSFLFYIPRTEIFYCSRITFKGGLVVMKSRYLALIMARVPSWAYTESSHMSMMVGMYTVTMTYLYTGFQPTMIGL